MELIRNMVRSGVRGVIALGLVATASTLALTGQEIPENIWRMSELALIFYFVGTNGNGGGKART
jgi:hypothetical protein